VADDLTTITRRWGQSLAESESIKAWCLSQFGKRHQVFLWPDLMTPPGIDDCPVIAISPDNASIDPDSAVQDASFWIGWAIAADGKVSGEGLSENSGGPLSDEFGRQILGEISGDEITHIQGVDYAPDKVHSFPIFPGEMLVSIKFKG